MKITQEIRKELAKIHARDAQITEESIVRASKRARSPLHEFFMWDDEEAAAHMGRLEIARGLLRKVHITPHEAEELNCSVSVRKYHGDVGGGYFDIRSILADETKRTALLAQALRELMSLQRRYEQLAELEPIFAAVKVAITKEEELLKV